MKSVPSWASRHSLTLSMPIHRHSLLSIYSCRRGFPFSIFHSATGITPFFVFSSSPFQPPTHLQATQSTRQQSPIPDSGGASPRHRRRMLRPCDRRPRMPQRTGVRRSGTKVIPFSPGVLDSVVLVRIRSRPASIEGPGCYNPTDKSCDNAQIRPQRLFRTTTQSHYTSKDDLGQCMYALTVCQHVL